MDDDDIKLIAVVGYSTSVHVLRNLNRHNHQGDHEGLSRQRMIKIKDRRVRRYSHNFRSPARIVIYNIPFSGIDG